jgi:hypothetical protein
LEFPNDAIFLFANSNGKRYIEFVGFNFPRGKNLGFLFLNHPMNFSGVWYK